MAAANLFCLLKDRKACWDSGWPLTSRLLLQLLILVFWSSIISDKLLKLPSLPLHSLEDQSRSYLAGVLGLLPLFPPAFDLWTERVYFSSEGQQLVQGHSWEEGGADGSQHQQENRPGQSPFTCPLSTPSLQNCPHGSHATSWGVTLAAWLVWVLHRDSREVLALLIPTWTSLAFTPSIHFQSRLRDYAEKNYRREKKWQQLPLSAVPLC